MSARLSWQTACELGFRGNLDEWERSLDAGRSDKPNVQKEASATGMLRRMKERIQLGRVVSPPSPHAPMHRAAGSMRRTTKPPLNGMFSNKRKSIMVRMRNMMDSSRHELLWRLR